MSDHPEALSITEAAQRTGVSSKTIRRWIKDGKITATTLKGPRGDEYRVFVSDLAALSEAPQKRPRAAPAASPLSDELRALKEAQERILSELQAQRRDIQSLEQELHDTRAQLSQFQDQLIKALPAPKAPGILSRVFTRKT